MRSLASPNSGTHGVSWRFCDRTSTCHLDACASLHTCLINRRRVRARVGEVGFVRAPWLTLFNDLCPRRRCSDAFAVKRGGYLEFQDATGREFAVQNCDTDLRHAMRSVGLVCTVCIRPWNNGATPSARPARVQTTSPVPSFNSLADAEDGIGTAARA